MPPMALDEAPELRGDTLAEVSNAVVHLFSEYYGRGPTRARTYQLDRYVLTVLEDTLTTVERTLIRAGHHRLVREVRLAFQEEMADQFMGSASRATGHEVLAYHSQIAFDPDVCFEIFVLGDELA
jgi:uncharacterized protein YbcI